MTEVDPAKLRELAENYDLSIASVGGEDLDNQVVRALRLAADEIERLLPYAKLARLPETEQEVEALEQSTVALRALDLLCAIRGHESVVVKHETLVALRAEIERLRADAERLDWLESRALRSPALDLGSLGEATVRAAIDAARQKF